MVACPLCKQSVAPGAETCDWCAVRLARDPNGALSVVLPSIRPGETVASRDFSFFPLPSLSERAHAWDDGDRVEKEHHGLVLTVSDGVRWFAQPYLSMRDGCVRVSFDALDPDTRVRVVMRKQSIGEMNVWYELSLFPDTRSYRLSRYFTSKAHSDGTELCPTAKHSAIQGLGETNFLELRVQGPTLEGWVNGIKVCAAHDAALGIGGVAIAGGTSEKARRILFRDFHIAEVAP